MAHANTTPQGFRLSEDWLATIIGLAIVLSIGLGLLGPGPQNVNITVSPGETAEQTVLPLDTWQVSATLDGERASVENAWTSLDGGQMYRYTCRDGVISGVEQPPADSMADLARSLVIVTNECDQQVVITQRTSPAIPWPLFGLF